MEMKLHTLIGQRKCSYPGEYTPEALAVADENTMEANPEWMESEKKKYADSDEFSALIVIVIYVHDDFIDEALFPAPIVIDGEVIVENGK